MVLSTRGPKLCPVYQAGKLGNFTLVQYPKEPGANEVAFSSLQRFKGLEADAVILCDVQEGRGNCTPEHLYVGTSRARHALIVAKYAPA